MENLKNRIVFKSWQEVAEEEGNEVLEMGYIGDMPEYCTGTLNLTFKGEELGKVEIYNVIDGYKGYSEMQFEIYDTKFSTALEELASQFDSIATPIIPTETEALWVFMSVEDTVRSRCYYCE